MYEVKVRGGTYSRLFADNNKTYKGPFSQPRKILLYPDCHNAPPPDVSRTGLEMSAGIIAGIICATFAIFLLVVAMIIWRWVIILYLLLLLWRIDFFFCFLSLAMSVHHYCYCVTVTVILPSSMGHLCISLLKNGTRKKSAIHAVLDNTPVTFLLPFRLQWDNFMNGALVFT